MSAINTCLLYDSIYFYEQAVASTFSTMSFAAPSSLAAEKNISATTGKLSQLPSFASISSSSLRSRRQKLPSTETMLLSDHGNDQGVVFQLGWVSY